VTKPAAVRHPGHHRRGDARGSEFRFETRPPGAALWTGGPRQNPERHGRGWVPCRLVGAASSCVERCRLRFARQPRPQRRGSGVEMVGADDARGLAHLSGEGGDAQA
jgi:hypothetical protein